ncbi:hypothetical protein Tco_0830397 [Tanacetum coccineum]
MGRLDLRIFELTEVQQLQDDCDVQATNIILYGLPPDVYSLVNHQKAAKDIWDRVKLLTKGTKLSYQERECRLMTMQQVLVNTKFLNSLPPEWSKFVTKVKLAKSLYTTNYDHTSINMNDMIMNFDTSVKSHTLVRIEAPSELPKVVKKRTTPDAISADEITEVQTVFNQMQAAVDQCSVDKNTLEIQIKQLRIDNDQLLNKIMSQENMHIAVNFIDILDVSKSCVDECNKSQSQEKDTVIRKLKDRIKSLSGKDSVENVKKDIDEIETINIKLEHSVAKLLSENKNLRQERDHLKSFYKDLFDSIKKTRVRSKEYSESLIAQINAKSVENDDLKAQIQEKVFANASLKNELRKLKRNSVDTKFAKPSIMGKPVLQPLRNQ